VSGVVDVLKEVLTLTSSVASLKSDIQRISTMILEMNERIIRLEASGELNAEKAKNAALIAFQGTNQQLMREMYSLRARIDALGSPKMPHLPSELGLASADGNSAE